MALLETIFTSMFTGFCSYCGARLANRTHKRIKKFKLKDIKSWFV